MQIRPPAARANGTRPAFDAKLLGVIILCIVGVLPVVLTRRRATSKATAATDNTSAMSAGTSLPLERTDILGVDVLMQRPSQKPPKGMLFVGHGCSHSHTDFWPSTPDVCPECIGLPEELAIVDMALNEFGFVVVGISSQNRDSKCWSSRDAERVANVLRHIHTQLKSENNGVRIPILAFGASSGGNFVGSPLVDTMDMEETSAQHLDGFIAQISAPEPRHHRTADQHTLPVAVYISMNRDTRTDEAVADIVSSMTRETHHAKHIRLDPLPVNDSFFHDRIPATSLDQSTAMVKALQQANYLDSDTKRLVEDPRRSDWREIVKSHAPLSDSLRPDESPISEVMNVAYGEHEMTRDGVREAIEYIIQGLTEQDNAA